MWKQIFGKEIKHVPIGHAVRVNGVVTALVGHYAIRDLGFETSEPITYLRGKSYNKSTTFPDVSWNYSENTVEIWED